jgi:hypothetical protein
VGGGVNQSVKRYFDFCALHSYKVKLNIFTARVLFDDVASELLQNFVLK